MYYDDHDSRGEVIKIFTPKRYGDYLAMIRRLAEWNYGTCNLCPVVKAEMDYG